MKSQRWFVSKVGKGQFGPYTEVEMREHIDAGQLRPTDQVCREGDKEWLRADTIPELFPSSVSPPPVPSPPLMTRDQGWYIIALLAIIAGILVYFTLQVLSWAYRLQNLPR
jgi:hypothetical protein